MSRPLVLAAADPDAGVRRIADAPRMQEDSRKGRADLLERVRARMARAGEPLVPAPAEEIDAAESQLGAPLPALLRSLYSEVTDAGFGPGLEVPIAGYPAGRVWPIRQLVEINGREPEGSTDFLHPPEGLLLIASLGGNFDVAIDCVREPHPILVWDADHEELSTARGTAVTHESWRLLAPGLEQWLTEWLNGRTRTPQPWPEWSSRSG